MIKGLTEVANLRPNDPIAFLANYLQNFSTDGKPKTSKKPEPEKKTEEKPTELKPKSAKTMIPIKQKSIDNLIDDDDTDTVPGSEDRDEHGQSMLHFAAARQHGKGALMNLIEETRTNVTYRDEIFRTARDVSLQASQPENSKEIDRYVLSLAAKGLYMQRTKWRHEFGFIVIKQLPGEYETFVAMLLDGYDHIIDIVDADGSSIVKVAKSRGHFELAAFLENAQEFEVNS